MNSNPEVTFTLNLPPARKSKRHGEQRRAPNELQKGDTAAPASIPRIARLMALAIRFEGLLQSGAVRDYAELARLGRVTRARMTQIMKLLQLAPDIQEQLLFLQNPTVLNERNVRFVVRLLHWDEQRRRLEEVRAASCSVRCRQSASPFESRQLRTRDELDQQPQGLAGTTLEKSARTERGPASADQHDRALRMKQIDVRVNAARLIAG